jgi:hypothetical protein
MAVYSTAVCDGRHKFGECPRLAASQAVEFFDRGRMGMTEASALCQVPARRRRRRVGALFCYRFCYLKPITGF